MDFHFHVVKYVLEKKIKLLLSKKKTLWCYGGDVTHKYLFIFKYMRVLIKLYFFLFLFIADFMTALALILVFLIYLKKNKTIIKLFSLDF